MMKTVANPARTVTDLPFLLYWTELGGVHRNRTGVRTRGVPDNHPIYTQTVQLMYPGSKRECVCGS
jgi:hypothetical protein